MARAQMRDLAEYLRAYKDYVSAGIGWAKALIVVFIWLSGVFAPFGIKTLIFDMPNWLALTWMAAWSLLGYVFAPYGMWRYHRDQIAGARLSRQRSYVC